MSAAAQFVVWVFGFKAMSARPQDLGGPVRKRRRLFERSLGSMLVGEGNEDPTCYLL